MRTLLWNPFAVKDGTAEVQNNNNATGHGETLKNAVAEIHEAEENGRIVENDGGSSDMVQLGSPSSLPNLSDASDNIPSSNHPRLSSALFEDSENDAVDSSAALLTPSPDFWDMAKKNENVLQGYVPRLLADAAVHFKATRLMDVTSAMHHIVGVTATFRDRIQGALDARHITLNKFSEELEHIFVDIVDKLRNISSLPDVSGHVERAGMVGRVLDDATVALVNLARLHGIDEEAVTTYLSALRPHVHTLVVVVGDINERHPTLFPIISFSIATLLIPEAWILRPLLNVFGFGPLGPIKGSAAAWMQSYFWGAAVEAGSWFSMLQAAGMGVLPVWAGLVTKVSMLGGGILTMLSSRWNRAPLAVASSHPSGQEGPLSDPSATASPEAEQLEDLLPVTDSPSHHMSALTMPLYVANLRRETIAQDVINIHNFQKAYATEESQFIVGLFYPVKSDDPIFAEVVVEDGKPSVTPWIPTKTNDYLHITFHANLGPFTYTVYAAHQIDTVQCINRSLELIFREEPILLWRGDVLVLKSDRASNTFVNIEFKDKVECEEFLVKLTDDNTPER